MLAMQLALVVCWTRVDRTFVSCFVLTLECRGRRREEQQNGATDKLTNQTNLGQTCSPRD